MERRKHSRRKLKTPIPCMCSIGDDAPLHGFIMNVGIKGVMVEVPDIEDELTVDCCVPIAMDHVGQENGRLFTRQVGMMSWVYKEFVGIEFDLPICSSQEELSRWFHKNDQLCD